MVPGPIRLVVSSPPSAPRPRARVHLVASARESCRARRRA